MLPRNLHLSPYRKTDVPQHVETLLGFPLQHFQIPSHAAPTKKKINEMYTNMLLIEKKLLFIVLGRVCDFIVYRGHKTLTNDYDSIV